MQEALLKAMQVWPYHPLPQNPAAWLYRVANNHLIDQLRRTQKTVSFELPADEWTTTAEEATREQESGSADEQLKMIFACCHPALRATEQVMLCLKLLCGLSVQEIARALMKEQEAVKMAITRAKANFQERIGKLEQAMKPAIAKQKLE